MSSLLLQVLKENQVLSRYGCTRERGFMGASDPIVEVPLPYRARFLPWLKMGEELPELLRSGRFQEELTKLPVFAGKLEDVPEGVLWRVAISVDFLLQAVVWGNPRFPKVPNDRIPASLAVLACRLGKLLGVSPLLVYASYALKNWKRINPHGPITAENVTMIQHFNSSQAPEAFVAEDWFVAIHVEIERIAGSLLEAMFRAEDGRKTGNSDELLLALVDMTRTLIAMQQTLSRMSERCDSETYFTCVRPYLAGFSKIPQGVIYEGVSEFNDKPQYFDGQTGAQSSIMPAFDKFLCISHRSENLSAHLRRMLAFNTPPAHRRLVHHFKDSRRFRDHDRTWDAWEKRDKEVQGALVKLRFAAALFRREHYILAITHIARIERKLTGNKNPIGTGGTTFIPSLFRHIEETLHPSEREVRTEEFRKYFQNLLGRPLQ